MVRVELATLMSAATALGLAGQHRLADELIDSAEPEDSAAAARLAVLAARIAIEGAWWSDTGAEKKLARAEAAVAASPDPVLDWDVRLCRAKWAYVTAVFADDRSGAAQLADTFDDLRDSAPDERREGWALFFGGVLADNLLGDAERARAGYQAARDTAERTGDDLLLSYALRHLADHAREAGDPAAARDLAWRATALREQAGFVPGTLAQRLMLADLAIAGGDPAGAATIARDVERAARAAGWDGLAGAAAGLAESASETLPAS